jgi:hypothetical protein
MIVRIHSNEHKPSGLGLGLVSKTCNSSASFQVQIAAPICNMQQQQLGWLES